VSPPNAAPRPSRGKRAIRTAVSAKRPRAWRSPTTHDPSLRTEHASHGRCSLSGSGAAGYGGMALDHRSGVAVTTPHSLENLMGLLSLTRRAGKDATVAVTGAMAAVTGAATGAVDGAIRGAGQALGSGPRATPAAAVAVAAVGAAGLIEWPVLLLASGTALVVRQLRHKPANPTAAALPPAQPGTPIPPAPNRVVADTPARKATAPAKASAPRTSTAPPKTSTSRQTTATRKASTPRKVTAAPAATSNREDRHVTPNPKGGWDVKAPEAERASDHKDTQAEAISRAEEITRNTGGQTVIHKTDGTTRE